MRFLPFPCFHQEGRKGISTSKTPATDCAEAALADRFNAASRPREASPYPGLLGAAGGQGAQDALQRLPEVLPLGRGLRQGQAGVPVVPGCSHAQSRVPSMLCVAGTEKKARVELAPRRNSTEDMEMINSGKKGKEI